jgi:hypothetical protein
VRRSTIFGLCLAATVIAAVLVGEPAAGEQTGGHGLKASFNGEFAPKRLPRRVPAPVRVTLSGSIAALDGSLPRLTGIDLAFGARGGLDAAGLPRCPLARLRNATARQALARCRDALVGRGRIDAEVPLSPERPLPVRAGVLAFNGWARGGPAVWVHAFSAAPPTSFVLPFFLRRSRAGGYGVLLHAPLARALGQWPRLRSFRIVLGRRYRAGGVARSYLSASCPLPPRFSALPIPLAKATYHFASKPSLTTTTIRACRVRD